MDNRRFFRQAMMLTLAAGLLASCSKDNNSGEPDSGINNALVAITPEVSFVTENSLSETYTPSGPVDGTENLTLYFIKGEETPPGSNMFNYGTEQIAANRPADNGDNVPENPKDPYYEPLTFEDIMYYPIDGTNIRMWGWYPKANSYSTGMATWTFDGDDDLIMASGKTGNNKMTSPLQFEFEHILTQVQFIIHAESELALNYWGNVTSISLKNENNTCSFMVAYGDNYINTGQNFKTALMLPPTGSSIMSISGSMAISNESQETLEADEAKRNSCLFGNLIVTPRLNSPLTVYVTTSKQGTVEFPVTIESHTYNAGEATRIYLNFLPGEITATLQTGNWRPVTVDDVVLGEYPYVQRGYIVISKDLLGESGAVLHENWTGATPAHIYTDKTVNTVSASFEVAETDCEDGTTFTWGEAATKCSEIGPGWRVPTAAELLLMRDCKSQLETSGALSGAYWSATEVTTVGGDDAVAVDVDADDKIKEVLAAKNDPHKVRCVRDI